MTICSAQTIRTLNPLYPFRQAYRFNGVTGGLGPCGYDIALAEPLHIGSRQFVLASSRERFIMPNNLMARVCDKSSWARQGLRLGNTVIEPGWRGYLTLEITNDSSVSVFADEGTPIAQVIFELLDHPTELPYSGKYQDQDAGPQAAR